MRKSVLLLLLIFGCVVCSNAQVTRLQAREAEWKNYAIPKTNFARQINPDKNFVFRVPADWKQEGSELTFTGPHSSTLKVVTQTVPDGYPLQDYFASMLRILRDTPGTEVIATRKTQLQDLEAREVYLETTGSEGDTIRSTSWVTVKGPLMVMFNLLVPVTHAAEIEPFFKAVVQSVIFVSDDYAAFEAMRSWTLKSPAPGPIYEIESIVASLSEVNTDRETAVTRLIALFSSHADVALDLLLDRRPFVRAGAIQALARSNNSALTRFLWETIDDEEPIVAEAAARAVASAPDVVAKTLEQSVFGHNTEIIARIWPFMSRDKRNELLEKIFSETAVPRPAPRPAKPNAKGDVKITVGQMKPVPKGTLVAEIINLSNDPKVQIGALTLLSTLPAEEFKLPLARIVASNYSPLIAVALQVAHYRGELLPPDSLLKLAASSDKQVSKLAVQCLALSANVSDIPRVEALISKNAAASKKELDDELKLTIRKIRFLHELKSAKSVTEAREIVNKGLADSTLADFAWRYDCENSALGCSQPANLKRDLTVKPLAENLFPRNIRHYTVIPNPRQAVQKLYETLNGLQMDSPRAQSNLILTMGSIRQSLAQEFSAPVDAATLIDYTGIDPDSPIAFGAWTSEKSPNSRSSFVRKAIILRVKDRQRFERTLARFQRSGGAVTDLTDYVGVGTRAIAALPAMLPLTAQAILFPDPAGKRTGSLLNYSLVGDKEWNGLRVRTIEHHRIDSGWSVQSAVTHIVFVGDTAIVASDLTTIRELLDHADERTRLAENPEFRKAIERRGDVVYFSDLQAVMSQLSDETKGVEYKVNESGALNIGNASWENSHHLTFDESDWAKPLLPFHPKELSAPQDLLPAGTIAYWLMKIDLPAFWSSRFKDDLLPNDLQSASKLWSLDFERDVLPELGPECGAVLLELPHVNRFTESGTWAVFCKLKSNKLADALTAGKLFSGVGSEQNSAEVKLGKDSYFITTRNGFILVSNNAKGLAAFDGKSSLSTTRDYSRAVEKVPNGIVAFGGYNLEAAIAAARNPSAEGMEAQIANIIFSVASAFHSQNFFATATAGTFEARSSVAMDREGRYAVADLSFLPRASNITFVTVEPSGVPITDQNRLSDLVLKVRAKATGPIDNIKDDIKTPEQTVEQKSANELLLTIAARRSVGNEKTIELPVKDPQFQQYLKATPEFAVDNQQVKDKAREIAGVDRDAWSVARKLADWTHKNLEWKHVERANAAETLATREADCSEFSALFVAMARSLGLPSRMVTGLAYSGNSFGGHAWVEVWTGKWVELDPTWGTHFVDATHIRDTSNALVMSAALNLIELEVLETKRSVADFQKSPKALMDHLLQAIPAGAKSDLEAAVDLETLTDEFMGAGSWAKLSDAEREQMWSAYRRLLTEIQSYGKHSTRPKMRLLHLEEKGNIAEATCRLEWMDLLLKLRLVRRNDVWSLVEILQSDSHLHSAAEAFRPTVSALEESRAGKKPSPVRSSDFMRVLLLLQQDSQKAIAAADEALKHKPRDQALRLLKALSFLDLEKETEATTLLRELSNEGFGPAVYKLADYLSQSEDENQKREAISFYERYISLEPHDPRAFRDLARAYDGAKKLVEAESAYRKAIERDPGSIDGYLDLMHFLIVNDRIEDARSVLAAADKYKDADEDLFGSALQNLHIYEEPANAEKFAATEPLRMKTSYQANYSLAQIFVGEKRYADALRLLETAAQLDKESPDPHVEMAMVYRRQSRWTAAVKAARRAIELDAEDSEAYYQLACALTRLGRAREALAALTKSVELDEEQTEYMVDEPDLKALSRLPGFKKLIPEPVKQ